jgi:gentisate 1,2-dioxygenase
MEGSGYSRHVAQVGDDPALRAFSVAARRRDLLPGWEFVGGIPNEPVPVEHAYRWSWAETLRPTMLEAYDLVDPLKAERRNLIMVNPASNAPPRPRRCSPRSRVSCPERSPRPTATPPARSGS